MTSRLLPDWASEQVNLASPGRQSAKLASLIAAALAGWLLIQWIDARSSAIFDLRVDRLQMATLSAPEIAAVASAAFTWQEPPFRHQGRYGVARLETEIADPRTADLALFIKRARDNYAVYVNGRLASPTPGTLGIASTLHGYHPRLVPLLPALLTKGVNRIDILSARNATTSSLREVYFGPASRLQPAFEHTQAVVYDLALFAAIIAGIVLLFALALSSLIRKPALILTIALTMAFFLARELHTLWVNQAWPQVPRDAFLLIVVSAMWISASAFVNEWTDGPPARRRRFLAAGLSTAAAICAFYVFMDCGDAQIAGNWVELAAAIFAVPFMTWRLFRFYRSAPASAAAEIFVAAIGLIMAVTSLTMQIGIDRRLSALSAVHGEAFGQLASITLILMIAIGLTRYGAELYRLAEANSETLAARVRQKERELEANHAVLRGQEREHAALTERSRIMRDVHDGIGSQLLGLLLQARAGHLEGAALTGGLQSALDDLHLVVDSLDQVDGPLETALGAFRHRIEPRCRAVGIEVDWRIGNLQNVPAIGPAAVLQIYRILQEACTNAIKHADTRRLEFALDRSPADAARIEISVRDDGSGFDTTREPAGGRGLSSMRRRAFTIGANLGVESGPHGTCVRILLPA